MSDNKKTRVSKRKKLAIVLVVVIIIVLSAVDISAKTYSISPSPATTMQSDLNSLVISNASHYNFRIGYINFTKGNSEITFGYFLRPFNGVNPVYAGFPNYSHVNSPASLAIIVICQISSESSSNPSSVPFTVSHVTLNSPQGFNGKTETWESVEFNSFGIVINPPGPFIQSFSASPGLGQYPGYHNFYLNFTFTIYSALGPYKIPSQSKTVHLEYNNTIVV